MCTHECERCLCVFTHHPNCDGRYSHPEFGLCPVCTNEGFSIGFCPSCQHMKPIHDHDFLCETCRMPKVVNA